MPQTPAQKRARANYQRKMPEAFVRARKEYDKKKPVVAFRLEISEREQMEMIQQAKETLNEAVRRVFRVGLEIMKGEK